MDRECSEDSNEASTEAEDGSTRCPTHFQLIVGESGAHYTHDFGTCLSVGKFHAPSARDRTHRLCQFIKPLRTNRIGEGSGRGRMTFAAITPSIPPINVSQARAAKTDVEVSPLIANVTMSVNA